MQSALELSCVKLTGGDDPVTTKSILWDLYMQNECVQVNWGSDSLRTH